MNKWIAVMAGTPVDTEMGVEVLRQHGLAAALTQWRRTRWHRQPFRIRTRRRKWRRCAGC